MPEIITKSIGLDFSKAEIEIVYNRKFDYSNNKDCEELYRLLEKSHKAGEFESFGFFKNQVIDEIYINKYNVIIYF